MISQKMPGMLYVFSHLRFMVPTPLPDKHSKIRGPVLHQLLMRSMFDKAALIQDQNFILLFGIAQPVRD
jgi:hypothetical protein